MAGLAQESGRYDEAEALYKKTLAIRERLLGDSHPELALTLNDFAVLIPPKRQEQLILLSSLVGTLCEAG